jgi:hypothetical protein
MSIATGTRGISGGDVEMHTIGSNKQNERSITMNTKSPGPLAVSSSESIPPTLVNDLLDENARLKRQLEDLKAQINRSTSVAPQQSLGPAITGLSALDTAARGQAR